MIHKMQLDPFFYEQIKLGNKTIELRLNDEKRKIIKIGDEIKFIKTTTIDEKIITIVEGLIYSDSFSNLASKISIKNTGFKNKKELLNKLEEIYSQEKIIKYGVVGIAVKLRDSDNGK